MVSVNMTLWPSLPVVKLDCFLPFNFTKRKLGVNRVIQDVLNMISIESNI